MEKFNRSKIVESLLDKTNYVIYINNVKYAEVDNHQRLIEYI
jgi:hypothetical protein